eukprot:Unigene15702_Nuclearia_a/m.46795 Unigene15702_Nuclearia_a/g.46795  ORF Unigene15702_Nuclearia_a/g.46795 Unigene15702_Nuclearia_a/m.46795 type:complete len:460 (+) Unigene15702_Nuclearia_a:511-1890(+)
MLARLHKDKASPFDEQVIDTMYLDTTFCMPTARVFPSRERSIADVLQVIAEHPSDRFHLAAGILGYEGIWRAIFHRYGQKIHVDTNRFSLYEGVLMDGEPVQAWLTVNGAGTRFHACSDPRHTTKFGDASECYNRREPGNFWTIDPSTMWWVNHKHALRAVPSTLQKTHDTSRWIRSFFAFHSSVEEMQLLVAKVRPRKLVFTVSVDAHAHWARSCFAGLTREETPGVPTAPAVFQPFSPAPQRSISALPAGLVTPPAPASPLRRATSEQSLQRTRKPKTFHAPYAETPDYLDKLRLLHAAAPAPAQALLVCNVTDQLPVPPPAAVDEACTVLQPVNSPAVERRGAVGKSAVVLHAPPFSEDRENDVAGEGDAQETQPVEMAGLSSQDFAGLVSRDRLPSPPPPPQPPAPSRGRIIDELLAQGFTTYSLAAAARGPPAAAQLSEMRAVVRAVRVRRDCL